MGLLALAVALAVVCIIAGRWQWSVAHDVARADAVREVQEQPVRPLAEVMAPHESFPDDGSGQRVTTRGEYTGDRVLVVDRLLELRSADVDHAVIEPRPPAPWGSRPPGRADPCRIGRTSPEPASVGAGPAGMLWHGRFRPPRAPIV